jgi:tripartite-type tricarboxylate transporter receptor subunit TctC
MPKHKRVWRIVFLACMVLVAGAVSSAEFARRPVRFLIGFTPGGGTDQLARILSPRLSEKWGQPVVIENRPGADGDIALEILMGAASDGHTLVFATNALTITPSLRTLKYDPINSFAPVTMAAAVPGVLTVRASLPVNTLKELIALAKAKPGQLNFGSSGTGTTPYLQMALLMKLTGIQIASIPYKGTTAPALLSGEIDMSFLAVPAIYTQVKAGKVKALAVSTLNRAAQLPDVPTVAEAADLPGFEAYTWYGVLAPAATPRAVINKLRADIAAVMSEPEIRHRTSDLGFLNIVSTPEAFSATMKSDIARWSVLLKSLDVK